MGKGENAGNQHFLLFPCFLPSNKQFSIFHLFHFMLSSANALNLVQSKLLSSGNGLTRVPFKLLNTVGQKSDRAFFAVG